jgi:hypothetical protein
MHLGKEVIQWASKVTYLGISFIPGRRKTSNIDTATREFNTVNNCIVSNVGNLDELPQLHLQHHCCFSGSSSVEESAGCVECLLEQRY